uniref:HIT domain-containing protein n=1 Tax=viral metagenome TaxID=1070528 RepID=A0A6C0I574_9ZZZZ
MLDIKKLKRKLLNKGFYDIITSSCNTNNNNNNINLCQNRIDQIKIGNIQDTEFITITTPCRIGRDINCMIESDTMCNSSITCPLCYFTKKNVETVCTSIDKIKRYNLDDGFIMIPNAFPYLDNHFLITVSTHVTQFDMITNSVIQLFGNIYKLLLTNPTGVIFFNGMCGNSLEHFHCQITTTEFPIFKYVPSKNGLINTHGFRGWFITFSYENRNIFYEMIDKLKKTSYNFILKIHNDKFHCIFFIRNNCNKVRPNLNFGSTELAGVIGSNKDNFPNKDVIDTYLDITNNVSNYTFF